VDALIERKAQVDGVSPEQMRAAMLAEYPNGRMPEVGDVAEAVLALMGPAGRALHGSTLFADGGIRRSIF
jgi:NAD(P)-dependent dehydrogenase (short-subunit alcohol dehydrogenase family)